MKMIYNAPFRRSTQAYRKAYRTIRHKPQRRALKTH